MSDYIKVYARYTPSESYELVYSDTKTSNDGWENIRVSLNDSRTRLQVKIEASTKEFLLDFLGFVYYHKRVK